MFGDLDFKGNLLFQWYYRLEKTFSLANYEGIVAKQSLPSYVLKLHEFIGYGQHVNRLSSHTE